MFRRDALGRGRLAEPQVRHSERFELHVGNTCGAKLGRAPLDRALARRRTRRSPADLIAQLAQIIH